jgi:Fe-S oxidoreductase
VRKTDADACVVADGFSCRTQVEQGAGRRAHHLAELLADAIPQRSAQGD